MISTDNGLTAAADFEVKMPINYATKYYFIIFPKTLVTHLCASVTLVRQCNSLSIPAALKAP